MGLKFAKVRKVKSPERAGIREAGIDFYVPDDFKSVSMLHGDSIVIPMGVKVCLPEVHSHLRGTHEYCLKFENKSGVASKKGLVVGANTIDVTYQGELFLNLHNNTNNLIKADGSIVGNSAIEIKAGDKIVQGILLLVNTEVIKEVDEDNLYSEKSQRGAQGFGSNYKEK